VVYVILEGENDGSAGRNGGLLPHTLSAKGWEPREDKPHLYDKSTLVVYAKRVESGEVLELPEIADGGPVLMLVVKVDGEAFHASVEARSASGVLQYDRTQMVETVMAWSDRPFRFTWLPTGTIGGHLFQGQHIVDAETIVHVRASGAARVYAIVESEHKSLQPRTGGLTESLPEAGWRAEGAAPSWNDVASTMRMFSRFVPEGADLLLPSTNQCAVFSIVVVSISSSSERVLDELHGAFKVWDVESKGAVAIADMRRILQHLSPEMTPEMHDALWSQLDRGNCGRVKYAELLDKLALL
jgi:hypothetical protein